MGHEAMDQGGRMTQSNTGVQTAPEGQGYQVVDLNYVSLYIHDLEPAIAFYSRVFGAPEHVEDDGTTVGWRMGATWLTLFAGQADPRRDRNPANAEFAIQVSGAPEVDALHAALTEAGATTVMAPRDTWMYEAMRFACVDDPFGVRIDVYHPLGPAS
jgi:predicted enzyme related to lactoylglutathione lyase